MGGRAGGGASAGMGKGSRGGGFNGVESRVSGEISLQGIGKQPGVKGSDLKAGDTVLWNYGYTSKISSIVKQTAKTVTVSFENGRNKTFGANSIVGVVTKDNAWQSKGSWK